MNTLPISLAFLTLFELPPHEAIKIAAEVGYDMIGLRLLPARLEEKSYPLLEDKNYLKTVTALLKSLSIKVSDIELIRIKSDFKTSNFKKIFECGAELQAQYVTVVIDDDNEARATENLFQLCQLGKQHQININLEFMPWTKVPDLNTSLRIINHINLPNAHILIDALHFDRSHSSLKDLAKVPSHFIKCLQVCDAKKDFDPSDEELIRVARSDRLFPGDGDLDLLQLLKTLPKDIVISVEVPNFKLAQNMSAKDRAIEGLKKTKAMIDASWLKK